MKNYQRYVLFSLFVIGITSCSDNHNYINHEIAIIGEKITGVWVDKENINDSVFIFIDKIENQNELFGFMSNDFEIIGSGFKASWGEMIVEINKMNGKAFFVMHSHGLLIDPRSFEIELLNDDVFRLSNYKEYKKVKSLK